MGHSLPTLDWGWTSKDGLLKPVKTDAPAALERLLQLVSCECKNRCQKNCSCRKVGIFCSVMCSGCNGQMCSPPSKITAEISSVEDE